MSQYSFRSEAEDVKLVGEVDQEAQRKLERGGVGVDLDDLSLDGSITKSPAKGNFRVGPRSIAVSKAPNARWSPTGAASPSPWSAPAPTGTTHRCSNPPCARSRT